MKDVLTIKDLMKKLDCCDKIAYQKMKEIKTISDNTGMAGKCFIFEYELWKKRKNKNTQGEN